MVFKIRKIVVLEFPQSNHLFQRRCWAAAFHPALPFLKGCSPISFPPQGPTAPNQLLLFVFVQFACASPSPLTVSQVRPLSLSTFSSALASWIWASASFTLNLSASAISLLQSNSSGCSTSLVSALSVQQQQRWAWPLPETRVGCTNHSCPGVGWQDGHKSPPAIWIKPQTTWSLHLLIQSPLNSLISRKVWCQLATTSMDLCNWFFLAYREHIYLYNILSFKKSCFNSFVG